MPPLLQDRRIVLGISGGIAAYKGAELVRLLVREGARVNVVLTESARQFVTELTLQTLSGNPVATSLFDLDQESKIGHIRLADEAELLVVAPATADVIARFAHGLANDLLTTIHLATRAPLLLAPAMNVHMWEHPLTQANLRRLVDTESARVVGPADGELACGYTGAGRMVEPATVLEAIEGCLAKQDLAGERFLITAGPTCEPVDAVRALTNRSSGKMGFAVARAARARGADVTLVAGPTALETPLGVERVDVRTAAQMKVAVLERATAASAVVMVAAVADYRPEKAVAGKIRKEKAGEALTLRLVRTDDILATLGRERRAARAATPVLVGFAAEWAPAARSLGAKLRAKGCDLLVANDIGEAGSGFDSDTNRVRIVGPDGSEDLARAPKLEIAHQVLDRVVPLLRRPATRPR